MITEGTEVVNRISKKRKNSQSKRQGAEVAKSNTMTSKASYAKLNPDNRKWVAQKAAETGHPVTTVVNQVIEAVRTNKKFTLDTYEPKYLKRAMEAQQNRVARLKKIAAA